MRQNAGPGGVYVDATVLAALPASVRREVEEHVRLAATAKGLATEEQPEKPRQKRRPANATSKTSKQPTRKKTSKATAGAKNGDIRTFFAATGT